MKDVLTYNGFVGSVQYLAKEEKFAGRVMNINPEVTFEGDSHQSLVESFHKAVDEYVAKTESPFTGNLNCPITKPLHLQLVSEANEKGISLNQYVIEILEQRIP